jgi:hypothetical protein
MGRECGMDGICEKYKILVRKHEGRMQQGRDLGVTGRIMLK